MQQGARAFPTTSKTAENKLPVEPFGQTLAKHGLNLTRDRRVVTVISRQVPTVKK
jgi:hypothetical protein